MTAPAILRAPRAGKVRRPGGPGFRGLECALRDGREGRPVPEVGRVGMTVPRGVGRWGREGRRGSRGGGAVAPKREKRERAAAGEEGRHPSVPDARRGTARFGRARVVPPGEADFPAAQRGQRGYSFRGPPADAKAPVLGERPRGAAPASGIGRCFGSRAARCRPLATTSRPTGTRRYFGHQPVPPVGPRLRPSGAGRRRRLG